jgi:hypothetical protein
MPEFLESCHVCGYDIASEAESCRNCGAKANPVERQRLRAILLAELEQQRAEEMEQEREREQFWLVLIGALIVGGISLVFLLATATSR